MTQNDHYIYKNVSFAEYSWGRHKTLLYLDINEVADRPGLNVSEEKLSEHEEMGPEPVVCTGTVNTEASVHLLHSQRWSGALN